MRPSPRSATRPPSRRQALALLAAAPAGAAATACGDSGSSGDAITLVGVGRHPARHRPVERDAPAGGESIFQRLSAAIAAGSGAPDWYRSTTTTSMATPELTVLVISGSPVSTLPLLVVFFAMQRYWRAGLTVGALR